MECRYLSPDATPYNPAYASGTWDGFVYLFDRRRCRFPSGLAVRVLEFLKRKGVQYAVEKDLPALPPSVTRPFSPAFSLRPYQEEAVERALKYKRGVISIPTGGGKTEVMQRIGHELAAPRILVLVPSRALLRQTVRRFKAVFPEEVVIQWGDGKKPPDKVPEQYILVATAQSAFTLDHAIVARANVVFVDESHHQSAAIFRETTVRCKDARYVYGFSATPFRHDGTEKELEGWIGQIIYEVSYDHLIDNGWLVPPKFKTVMSLADGLAAIRGKRAFIFSETEQALLDGKVHFDRHNVKILTAKSPRISEALDDFRAGKLHGIACTPMFDEGLDIPDIEAVFFYSACRSPVKAIQRIGRGMRTGNKLDGTPKAACDVVDLRDEAYYHRVKAYQKIPAFKRRLMG